MVDARFVFKFFDGFSADAAGRFVDDALQSQVVGRLQNHPQIGEGVANFRPFVKFRSADNLIGDGFGNEFFFKFPGLRSGADKNGHLAVAGAVAVQVFDFVGDIGCFFRTAVGADDFDFAVVAAGGGRIFRHL